MGIVGPSNIFQERLTWGLLVKVMDSKKKAIEDDSARKAVVVERLGYECQDALVASCGGLDQMDHTSTLSDKWEAVHISTMLV